MKDFKLLDDKSDVDGMEYMMWNSGFSGKYLRLEFYHNLTKEELFQIQMHLFALHGTKDMDLEENQALVKEELEKFVYRPRVTRLYFNEEGEFTEVEPT